MNSRFLFFPFYKIRSSKLFFDFIVLMSVKLISERGY